MRNNERNTVCGKSFLMGSFMAIIIATIGWQVAGSSKISDAAASRHIPPLNIDYDRLELSAENINNSAKIIYDTERAWEIIAAKIILDYESKTKEVGQRPSDRRIIAASSPVWMRSAPSVSEGKKQLSQTRMAENGSWYGQPNANGVPKTVRVRGYYRKDGTYVRGHYRSSPSSR